MRNPLQKGEAKDQYIISDNVYTLMKSYTIILLGSIISACSSVPENREVEDNYYSPDSETVARLLPQKSPLLTPDVSVKTYKLSDITVTVAQTRNDGTEFYCKCSLIISRNHKIIDGLFFAPEPLGGDYGISEPVRINNHLIFSKHGDYDGRTIIINSSGNVYNIIGGINYYDSDNGFLFSLYESDLGGLAVFDLKNDELLIDIQNLDDYPVSIHKAYGGRYFLALESEASGQNGVVVWEIKPKAGTTEEVSLDPEYFTPKNMLKTWKLPPINCGS